jgi:hypothetical protein
LATETASGQRERLNHRTESWTCTSALEKTVPTLATAESGRLQSSAPSPQLLVLGSKYSVPGALSLGLAKIGQERLLLSQPTQAVTRGVTTCYVKALLQPRLDLRLSAYTRALRGLCKLGRLSQNRRGLGTMVLLGVPGEVGARQLLTGVEEINHERRVHCEDEIVDAFRSLLLDRVCGQRAG